MTMKRREVEFPGENPAEMIRADLYTANEGNGPWPVVIMGGGGVGCFFFLFAAGGGGAARRRGSTWIRGSRSPITVLRLTRSATLTCSRASSIQSASACGAYPTLADT